VDGRRYGEYHGNRQRVVGRFVKLLFFISCQLSPRLIDLQLFVRLDAFPNVIEAMVSGKYLDQFELSSDQKVVEDCQWMLEKFLNRKLPRPIDIKKTKWKTKDNFCGSYSYQSLAAHRNGIFPRDLAKSLVNIANKPVVLFSGEHTDDQFASNAHGAIRSGIRVADELIEFLERSSRFS
jgi:spermine oxidase